MRVSFHAAPQGDGKEVLGSLQVLPTAQPSMFGAMMCGKVPAFHLEARIPQLQGLVLPLPEEGLKVVELPPTQFNRWTIEIEAVDPGGP